MQADVQTVVPVVLCVSVKTRHEKAYKLEHDHRHIEDYVDDTDLEDLVDHLEIFARKCPTRVSSNCPVTAWWFVRNAVGEVTEL